MLQVGHLQRVVAVEIPEWLDIRGVGEGRDTESQPGQSAAPRTCQEGGNVGEGLLGEIERIRWGGTPNAPQHIGYEAPSCGSGQPPAAIGALLLHSG